MLAEALELEIADFLSQYTDLKDDQGRMRVTRNGYLPEREIQTGIGLIPAKAPRIRDHQPEDESGRIRFSSSILCNKCPAKSLYQSISFPKLPRLGFVELRSIRTDVNISHPLRNAFIFLRCAVSNRASI